MIDKITAMLGQRRAFGLAKYSTTLTTNNGRRPLIDALDEILDFLVYTYQDHLEENQTESSDVIGDLIDKLASDEPIQSDLVTWALSLAKIVIENLEARGQVWTSEPEPMPEPMGDDNG